MPDLPNSLVGLIQSLSGAQLESLFVQPFTAVAILRSLPPVARHVLLRLTCSGGDVGAGAPCGADCGATVGDRGPSSCVAPLCERKHLGRFLDFLCSE